jgi:hypothetical protein
MVSSVTSNLLATVIRLRTVHGRTSFCGMGSSSEPSVSPTWALRYEPLAMTDLERAVIAAWRSLADVIVERDVEHERRAWGELRRMAPEQVGWECEG